MPQLEALLCGCPIVTAHNSAMIEVAADKDGAVTVEGYDPQTWIDTIIRTANERPTVNTSQLASYDWDIILKKFLENKL
jgi:glycosyltransferase involved in cell wall biosynthesis